MSREHFISEGVLKALSDDGITIEVQELPWLKENKKKHYTNQRTGQQNII